MMKNRWIVLILISIGSLVFAATPSLVINEVRSNDLYDFVELHNPSGQAVVIGEDWYLVNEKGIDKGSIPLTPGTKVESGSYAVVILETGMMSYHDIPGGIPVISVPWDEGKDLSDHGLLELISVSGGKEVIIDQFSWAGIADSWGYLPDGNGELTSSLDPSPGKKNRSRDDVSYEPELMITEIQTRGSSIFPYEFIELRNTGERTITGQGYAVSDSNRSPLIAIPEDLMIGPGEYVVVVPERYKKFDELKAMLPTEHVVIAPVREKRFGIGSEDEVILYLWGTVEQVIEWEDGPFVSMGIAEDGSWSENLIPSPGSDNTSR